MLDIKSLSDDLDKTVQRSHEATNPNEFVITQMTSGVRDQNRVNIYINQKFVFSLDARQVVDFSLKIGKVLTEAKVAELHSASEFGKLYQRALEWALTRPHSVWETRDYLKRRQNKRRQLNFKRAHEEKKPLPEIQDDTINLVLERLIDRGYVDDRKFAEFYVENRFVKKGISRRRMELELRKKHLSDTLINDVLTNSGRDEDTELAKMITKKRNKYDDQKLIQYLVNQGFDYQKVKSAVAQLTDDADF